MGLQHTNSMGAANWLWYQVLNLNINPIGVNLTQIYRYSKPLCPDSDLVLRNDATRQQKWAIGLTLLVSRIGLCTLSVLDIQVATGESVKRRISNWLSSFAACLLLYLNISIMCERRKKSGKIEKIVDPTIHPDTIGFSITDPIFETSVGYHS